jgi:nicotinamide-nucleotide amidase
VSIVELTTCGLISELLTSQPGSSSYFILGISPYTTEMKIKFGISPELLKHDSPGTVSLQAAEALAERVRLHSNSIIGLAETGMLPSIFESRRTQKRPGEVYFAINTVNKFISKKLSIQNNLSRILMRQAIAWELLKEFESYLRQELP